MPNLKSLHFLIYTILLFVFTSCTDDKNDEVITPPAGKYIEKNYTESNGNIINPERGFYKSYGYFFNSADNILLTEYAVNKAREEGYSLILAGCLLRNFRDREISADYLVKLRYNMEMLRKSGLKAILRFAYTNNVDDKPSDASWEITQKHIAQLKPVLQEYADVIYTLQAGFIGTWGEWYYTDNYVFSPKSPEDYVPRRRLLSALLDALPATRNIGVRTPSFTMNIFDKNTGDTLTIENAYNRSDYARVGGHNDCFLADDTDMGTFFNSLQREFWQANSRYTVMGGETCKPSTFAECSNTLKQLRDYHWSYLNMDYHQDVINNWVVNGCIEEIKRRLGYRLVLVNGLFSESARKSTPYYIKLNIKNTGWAAPVNPRGVEIVFAAKTGGKEYKFAVDVNAQLWLAGSENTMETNISLQQMEAGDYTVYLNLPDPEPALKNNPKFSIQLANTGIWDANKGYNLLHTVTVTD